MKKKNFTLNMRGTLAQQWYLTRLCFSCAPGYMLLHVFEAVKLQVSIFFEFTWCVNYVLEVAEAGGPWKKILWCMVLLMVGIGISTVSASIYQHCVLPKMKPMLYQTFRMRIYERAREMDLSCYDDVDFYQKFILATGEVDACIDRYLDTLQLYSGMSMQLILSGAYCILLNPVPLLACLAAIPFELWTAQRENEITVAARMERVEYEQKREYQKRIFYLSDYARDLRQHPGMQEKYRKDFNEVNEQIRENHHRSGKRIFLYAGLRSTIGIQVLCVGIPLSLLLYQNMVLHTLSLAHMITSYNASRYVFGRAVMLIEAWKEVEENSVYVASIRELTALKPTITSRGNHPLPECPAEVLIQNLSFSYVPRCPVLTDINLRVCPGQRIALVGYNGSGKTTLVKLLLRLYDPEEGRICLGGTDIREFDLEQYRETVGSVFQDFKIYAATLKENVLMDVGQDTREENYNIEKALHKARFTLQDRRLIYQIETPLTTEFEKDGVNLSGGEAQKVAIARTLYRKQNLIIMDEPSSALDPLSEYLLNQELHEIAEDKTVIFISHRLSTTRDADCIYMMEKGRIIEAGTHQELLKQNGKYAAMWRVQARLYQ